MLRGVGVNGTPNKDRKGCFDCEHCQAAKSWWCTNEIAASERGTYIPGVVNCPYWEPIPTKEQLMKQASVISRLLGIYMNGYIEVDLSKNKEEEIK